MKEQLSRLLELLAPYRCRAIGVLLGLVFAVLFLTIGFFKTLLILICVSAGFIIGYFFDDKIDFGKVVDKILSRVKGDK